MARRPATRLTDARIAALRPRRREYTVWDGQVAGLGVRVRPSGFRGYVYLDRAGGSARRMTLGPVALKGLEETRRECLALAATGQSGPKSAGDGARIPTFADFVAGPWRAACYERYKPTTARWVASALRRQLLPAFGAMRMDRITRLQVLRWFETYSRSAPTGANQTLGVLAQILNHAIARGHLEMNPVQGIRRNPRRRLSRFLSRAEVRRVHKILDRYAATRPALGVQADIIRLLLLTGCRKSEILRLRWQNLDEDRNVINLTDSKTGPRAVWLSAAARALIARQSATGSDWVFPSPRDPARPRSDELRLWFEVRREAGVEDVRLHDLRHTFASHAVLLGVPLPAVSRLLGHRQPRMTFRYAHVADAEVEAAAERVGATIALLLDGSDGEAREDSRDHLDVLPFGGR